MRYFAVENGVPAHNRGINDDALWNLKHKLTSIQAVFLLETAWCHPKPVELKSIRIGMRSVVFLQAELDTETFDYYLDSSTYLPIRVVRHLSSQYPTSSHLTDVYELSRYSPVAGIQMPSHVIISEVESLNVRWPYDVSYKFNVDYDPEVFERAPSTTLGRDAWKRK